MSTNILSSVVALATGLVACRPGPSPETSGEPAKVYSAPVYVVSPSSANLGLGRGINSLMGSEGAGDKSQCVQLGATQTFGNLNGAHTSFSVQTIKTSEEFYSKLGRRFSFVRAFAASKGASSNVGDPTPSEKGISFASLSEIKIKSENSYLYITASKVFQPQNLSDFIVSSDVISLYSAFPEKFFPNCGNAFISSVTPGITVTALMECSSDSYEMKKEIDAKMNARGGSIAVSQTGEISSSLQDIVNTAKGGCRILVESFGGEGTISTKLDDFAQSAVNFVVNAPVTAAVPVSFSTLPYDRVQNEEFLTKVVAKANMNFKLQELFIDSKKALLEMHLQKADTASRLLFLDVDLSDARKFELQNQQTTSRNRIQALSKVILACALDPTTSENCSEPSSGEPW